MTGQFPEPADGVSEAPAAAEVVRTAVAEAFRQEWGRINAALIRQTGDWDLAEECAQEAFARDGGQGGGNGQPGAGRWRQRRTG